MPRKKDCTCIVCGRESVTVVCMHCFFSYDYRTYNAQELEQTKPVGREAMPQGWATDGSASPEPSPGTWFSKLHRFS